jgi:hypothetical protein
VLAHQKREVFLKNCVPIFYYYRNTSQNHPELDGLTERVVQMVKQGFCKYKSL